MKPTVFAVSILLVGALSTVVVAQTAAVTHNTWASGTPLPTPVVGAAAAVLEGQIYVVGGFNGSSYLPDTQIYNPATDSWSTGVPLPIPGDGGVDGAAAAVVNNVLYVIGGSETLGGSPVINTVWAYSPKTKAWSSKAAMPTPRSAPAAVVVNGRIYVIGGWNGVFSGNGLATVESYNPATNTWTEESPLLVGKWMPTAGVFGTKAAGYTIAAPDGAAGCCPGNFTGDNEAYSVATNTWSSLNADPTARAYGCFGTIGSELYIAGGTDAQGPAINVTESFKLSKDAWKTLAPIPQATIYPGWATYKGQLYCFGGWDAWNGNVLNNVQIYQP